MKIKNHKNFVTTEQLSGNAKIYNPSNFSTLTVSYKVAIGLIATQL